MKKYQKYRKADSTKDLFRNRFESDKGSCDMCHSKPTTGSRHVKCNMHKEYQINSIICIKIIYYDTCHSKMA